ncbi:MAG: DNA endonuclease SmrA [Gammaproteobacteria bacterium]|nr:DNA endonuclease SmrA [Gammaproteobacteria bacterium]
MNEDNLFMTEMGDVKPLKDSNSVYFNKTNKADESTLARRLAAEAAEIKDPNFLSAEPVILVSPDDVLSYKKVGVQQGVFKNLRLGKYEIHTTLNLQGKSVNESRAALFQFINDCQKADLRVLLIRHGKGLKSQPHQAMLKSYINQWLRQFDQVLGFHSALPQHGGGSAVYVMLKKSDDARLQNKERHQKRGAN